MKPKTLTLKLILTTNSHMFKAYEILHSGAQSMLNNYTARISISKYHF